MKRHHFFAGTQSIKMSSATTAFKDNKEVTENAENLKSMKSQQSQDRKKTAPSQDIGTLHYDGKQKL